MTRYTFTYAVEESAKFKNILARLEPDQYTVIQPIAVVDAANPNYSDLTTVMDMDSDTALTFRMGMKLLQIRRERTEEELAAEKAQQDRHKVTITVVVPGATSK